MATHRSRVVPVSENLDMLNGRLVDGADQGDGQPDSGNATGTRAEFVPMSRLPVYSSHTLQALGLTAESLTPPSVADFGNVPPPTDSPRTRPLPPVETRYQPGSNGGTARGPTRKRFGTLAGRLRQAWFAVWTPQEMTLVAMAMLEKAKNGDKEAAKIGLEYTLGRPVNLDIIQRIERLSLAITGKVSPGQAAQLASGQSLPLSLPDGTPTDPPADGASAPG